MNSTQGLAVLRLLMQTNGRMGPGHWGLSKDGASLCYTIFMPTGGEPDHDAFTFCLNAIVDIVPVFYDMQMKMLGCEVSA